MKNSWAQIAIVHDKGYGIIGNGQTLVSKFQELPSLPKSVPVVDMRGVSPDKWQKTLKEYVFASTVTDVDWLVEDLNALK